MLDCSSLTFRLTALVPGGLQVRRMDMVKVIGCRLTFHTMEIATPRQPKNKPGSLTLSGHRGHGYVNEPSEGAGNGIRHFQSHGIARSRQADGRGFCRGRGADPACRQARLHDRLVRRAPLLE